MADYPYAANFLAPMPAWPVKVACGRIVQPPNGQPYQNLDLFYQAISVFYNYTGQAGTCNPLTYEATVNTLTERQQLVLIERVTCADP
jgi:hypothetical protein